MMMKASLRNDDDPQNDFFEIPYKTGKGFLVLELFLVH
jgi:hypothetical protein